MARRRCDELREDTVRAILRNDHRPWVRSASEREIVVGEVHRFGTPDGSWYSRRVLVNRPTESAGAACVLGLVPMEAGAWRTVLVSA